MRRRQRRLRSWWGQETVTSTRVGVRPGSVTDPRPQVRVQRHTVDQMVDAPLLPSFDVLVPLMVDQLLLGALSPFDSHVPELLSHGQTAEQWVEVPTIVSPWGDEACRAGLWWWRRWRSLRFIPRTEFYSV